MPRTAGRRRHSRLLSAEETLWKGSLKATEEREGATVRGPLEHLSRIYPGFIQNVLDKILDRGKSRATG